MSQANFPEKTTVREPWIDSVKALAILCVIIGHSGGMMITQPASMKVFGEWIVTFNMPLFVIMEVFRRFIRAQWG